MRRSAAILIMILVVVPIANAAALSITRVTTPPQIDGRLEPLWDSAVAFDEFHQTEPAFGVDAKSKTRVLLMRDDDRLYIAAKAYQPRATIRASSVRRDSLATEEGDHLLFAVDPQASGNSAYFFVINPVNSVADGTLDMYGTWSREWDARVVTAAAITDDSWSVEISVPLSAIGFSTAPGGEFGFLARRYFAEKQETSLSHIGDRNTVYRIDRFARLGSGEGSVLRPSVTILPYTFASWQSQRTAGASNAESQAKAKGGFDLRFTPRSTMTILATANPDFAQVESDQPIISVDDVPAAYPEKRPFFTESSDLYPGLAVNTRNIGKIRAGLKLRQILPTVRYDLTSVVDDQRARWTSGDVRWTDNRTYHVELIGGLKDAPGRSDYNVTTNLRTWALDRRFTAYTWFGTINSHEKKSNEWESVNSVRWETRQFRAGLWNHFKSELYNPNIVGFDTLSNEIIAKGWVSGSYFRGDGRLREITEEFDVERFDLYSSRGHSWNKVTGLLTAVVRPSETLGVWRVTLGHVPAARQLFRYRGSANAELPRYRDGYGAFALIEHRGAGWLAELNSDTSKRLSSKFSYQQKPLRGTTAREVTLEGTWRLATTSTLSASVDSVDVGTSPWQQPMKETISRVRLEHTFPRDVNLRGIVQTSSIDGVIRQRTPALNLLLSWPYDSKTTLYVVVNEIREIDGIARDPRISSDTRNVAVKVSHAISF